MARKKITVKTDKKDDLDPMKDKFITRSAAAFNWLMDRRKPVGVGIVVILVAVVGGIAIRSLLESGRAEASTLLDDGLEAALAPVIPAAERPPQLAEERPEMLLFETGKARAEESLKRFEKAATEEAGSPIGAAARLGLAAAQFDLGAYDKAEAAYREALGAAGEADWLKASALEGLGQALEAQGKLDEAIAQYKELGGLELGDLSLIGRFHEARVAVQKGDKEGAGKLLTQLLASVKESGRIDALNYLFVAARELLLGIDPTADVPALPQSGGLQGIDPELLRQLIEAKQAAGAGAGEP